MHVLRRASLVQTEMHLPCAYTVHAFHTYMKLESSAGPDVCDDGLRISGVDVAAGVDLGELTLSTCISNTPLDLEEHTGLQLQALLAWLKL